MKLVTWLSMVVWLGALIGLHMISRQDFYILWSVYSIAFGSYVLLLAGKRTFSLPLGLGLALLIRTISFQFEPLLSDDFYRYIWDGMLLSEGIHPMAYTPSFLMEHPELFQPPPNLYALLNSQNYYSVYPPVTQCIFGVSYLLQGSAIDGQILFYKGLSLVVDGCIIWLLYILLSRKGLPTNRVLWYALNPLVILEFSGNLHLDGVMIMFLLGAIVLYGKTNYIPASIAMAMSILTKMVTCILIPFLAKPGSWRSLMVYLGLIMGLTAGVFWISFGEHTGWFQSIRLWFQVFEFNAGFYYLLRELGYQFSGYNMIRSIGPLLAISTGTGLWVIWWKYFRHLRFDSVTAMVYALTWYFLMSTTVHPWYLITMFTLSVLTRHVYPLVWTYLVFLSYSHYQGGGFKENYILIAVEYLLLAGCVLWECMKSRKKPLPDNR